MKFGYLYWKTLNQVWSILPPLELLPLNCSLCSVRREQSQGSYSNAGKMDQTWTKKTFPSLSAQTVLGRC